MFVRKLGVLGVAASLCVFATTAPTAPAQQPASPAAAAPDTPAAPPNTETARLNGIAKDAARHFGSDPDDPGPVAKDLSPAIKAAAISAAIHKVADWQLAQSQQYFTAVDGRIWTWGALYTGFMAASESLPQRA